MSQLDRPRTSPAPATCRPTLSRARRTTAVLLAASLLAASPLHAQEDLERIDRIFDFVRPGMPGCAVGVARDGEVLALRTYGLADLERELPITPDTAFDIGSTHKQLVAACVLLLVEDGELALDADVRRWLPELPDYGHPLTLEHLMTHTSGVRDWTALLPLAEEGADVLDVILRQRGLNFVPGSEWSYSNSGYVLLKEIVARASGGSFAEFVHDRVFEPLGMSSSAYVEDVLHAPGERALAYQRQDDGWTPYMRLGNERGGGGVVSTAGDLLTWNEALSSRKLGDFVTETLEAPARLRNGRELSYAHALIVRETAGERIVSHSGGAAGFSAWLGRFTNSGLSVVVLANYEPLSAGDLAGEVSDLFLPPVDPEARPEGPVAVPGVRVEGRDGLFLAVDGGAPLILAARAGRLAIAGGPELVPVGEDRFRPPRPTLFFRSEDDFELRFESDDELLLTSMEGEVARYVRPEPWTPSEDDLRAAEGRYGCDELGRVIEIVAADGALLFRLEDTPEEAIETSAVARDLYMRRLVSVRFVRDESGAVTGFDYANPLVRGIRYERLGDPR